MNAAESGLLKLNKHESAVDHDQLAELIYKQITGHTVSEADQLLERTDKKKAAPKLGLSKYLLKKNPKSEPEKVSYVLSDKGKQHTKDIALWLGKEYGDKLSKTEMLAVLKKVHQLSVGSSHNEKKAYKKIVASLRAHVLFKKTFPEAPPEEILITQYTPLVETLALLADAISQQESTLGVSTVEQGFAFIEEQFKGYKKKEIQAALYLAINQGNGRLTSERFKILTIWNQALQFTSSKAWNKKGVAPVAFNDLLTGLRGIQKKIADRQVIVIEPNQFLSESKDKSSGLREGKKAWLQMPVALRVALVTMFVGLGIFTYAEMSDDEDHNDRPATVIALNEDTSPEVTAYYNPGVVAPNKREPDEDRNELPPATVNAESVGDSSLVEAEATAASAASHYVADGSMTEAVMTFTPAAPAIGDGFGIGGGGVVTEPQPAQPTVNNVITQPSVASLNYQRWEDAGAPSGSTLATPTPESQIVLVENVTPMAEGPRQFNFLPSDYLPASEDLEFVNSPEAVNDPARIQELGGDHTLTAHNLFQNILGNQRLAFPLGGSYATYNESSPWGEYNTMYQPKWFGRHDVGSDIVYDHSRQDRHEANYGQVFAATNMVVLFDGQLFDPERGGGPNGVVGVVTNEQGQPIQVGTDTEGRPLYLFQAYAHMASNKVETGQFVPVGHNIGVWGNEGLADGVHLDFTMGIGTMNAIVNRGFINEFDHSKGTWIGFNDKEDYLFLAINPEKILPKGLNEQAYGALLSAGSATEDFDENILANSGVSLEQLRSQELVVRRDIQYVQGDYQLIENEVNSEDLVPGSYIYVRSTEINYPYVLNNGEQQRLTDGKSIKVNRVYRVQVIDQQTGLLMPDNGYYNPYGNGHENVYLDLNSFEVLNHFEPLSVFSDTQNQDKEIVVLQDLSSPELLLIEHGVIVMRVPVFLGEDQTTPWGVHYVNQTRASKNMPSQNGVGFVNYFGGGFGLHDSPWWNWRDIDQGGYGSHGCVNLPSKDWEKVYVNGQGISVPEFVYRWISTNIDYDETVDERVEAGLTEESQAGFYTGETTVRLFVIDSILDLNKFEPLGSAESYDTVIQQYENLEHNQWVLPVVGEAPDAVKNYESPSWAVGLTRGWEEGISFIDWANSRTAPNRIQELPAFGKQVIQAYISHSGVEDRELLTEAISFFEYAFPEGEIPPQRTELQQRTLDVLYGGYTTDLTTLWAPSVAQGSHQRVAAPTPRPERPR
ncbi:MAG TPA: L,D-transpeptidase family protein [Vitreimonas sp.]|nr:L,D-transpeptidase family protein [Vitreimonas sp.]